MPDPTYHAMRRARDKFSSRVNRADRIEAALRRLIEAAAELSNHDRRPGKPSRTAGDWSRLHARIDEAREALKECGQ